MKTGIVKEIEIQFHLRHRGWQRKLDKDMKKHPAGPKPGGVFHATGNYYSKVIASEGQVSAAS